MVRICNYILEQDTTEPMEKYLSVESVLNNWQKKIKGGSSLDRWL
jgi:hypothetical protein